MGELIAQVGGAVAKKEEPSGLRAESKLGCQAESKTQAKDEQMRAEVSWGGRRQTSTAHVNETAQQMAKGTAARASLGCKKNKKKGEGGSCFKKRKNQSKTDPARFFCNTYKTCFFF